MIYSSCPTCGFFIGNVSENYEKEKEKISNNVKLSQEEKNNEISKLLRNLKIRRYCCRMRIMTCKNIVDEILPINQEKL